MRQLKSRSKPVGQIRKAEAKGTRDNAGDIQFLNQANVWRDVATPFADIHSYLRRDVAVFSGNHGTTQRIKKPVECGSIAGRV